MLLHFDLSGVFGPGGFVDVGGGKLDCAAIGELEGITAPAIVHQDIRIEQPIILALAAHQGLRERVAKAQIGQEAMPLIVNTITSHRACALTPS
jgi:hypothetical protein